MTSSGSPSVATRRPVGLGYEFEGLAIPSVRRTAFEDHSMLCTVTYETRKEHLHQHSETYDFNHEGAAEAQC